ncbi:TPA: exonuclease SbcCD subunit D [Candidatus Poribacteria bacterium]|nr:exonuclease SbcCD subunit D [Candidatus Poribacteria bacterium]
MRILHTSDWHIGHRLYERSRIDEHRQFLNWLLYIIKEEKIDALLVSGDIFDSALPSAESTDLYYQFLFRLYAETDASAVIIAGNHDSAIRLAAPKRFLAMARIHVVGGISDNLDECIITLDKENFNIAIAAVPYLSEGELLSHVSFESQIDRARRYREALKALYMQCLSKMSRRTPIMLMGHFFIHGGEVSESERSVQIGGSLPISARDLPPNIDYFALGHLHRPQRIKGREYPIVYSGSPLPMTFKEATYDKKLYILDLQNEACKNGIACPERNEGMEGWEDGSGETRRGGAYMLKSITIPVFKELCRVSGNFNDVMAEARSDRFNWQGKYIEVQLKLDAPVLGASDAIRNAFAQRGGEVLVVEALSAKQISDSDMSAEEITAKSPEDIFAAFYKSKYGDDEQQQRLEELMATFKELLALASEEDKK